MGSQKKYIGIRIEMGGDSTCVKLHAKRVSAKDLAEGYVVAAEAIAHAIAGRSDAAVSEALGAMAIDILALGAEACEDKED